MDAILLKDYPAVIRGMRSICIYDQGIRVRKYNVRSARMIVPLTSYLLRQGLIFHFLLKHVSSCSVYCILTKLCG
jgi:hypothetical protein